MGRAFRLEVLADEMVEAAHGLKDEAAKEVLLSMARRHRVEAIELRSQYGALVDEYVGKFGEAREI